MFLLSNDSKDAGADAHAPAPAWRLCMSKRQVIVFTLEAYFAGGAVGADFDAKGAAAGRRQAAAREVVV